MEGYVTFHIHSFSSSFQGLPLPSRSGPTVSCLTYRFGNKSRSGVSCCVSPPCHSPVYLPLPLVHSHTVASTKGLVLVVFSVPRGNDTRTPQPRPSINNSLSLGVGCCVPLLLLSPAALTPLVDSCMLLRWPKEIDRCLFLRSLAAKIRALASSLPYPPSLSTSTKGIPLLPPYLTLMALPTIITNNALRRLIIVSFCNLHGIHVFGRARSASRP